MLPYVKRKYAQKQLNWVDHTNLTLRVLLLIRTYRLHGRHPTLFSHYLA